MIWWYYWYARVQIWMFVSVCFVHCLLLSLKFIYFLFGFLSSFSKFKLCFSLSFSLCLFCPFIFFDRAERWWIYRLRDTFFYIVCSHFAQNQLDSPINNWMSEWVYAYRLIRMMHVESMADKQREKIKVQIREAKRREKKRTQPMLYRWKFCWTVER